MIGEIDSALLNSVGPLMGCSSFPGNILLYESPDV
jgi:hypothetical protein